MEGQKIGRRDPIIVLVDLYSLRQTPQNIETSEPYRVKPSFVTMRIFFQFDKKKKKEEREDL